MESIFRVKVDDRWSIHQYGETVEFAEDAREFTAAKNARSHIRNVTGHLGQPWEGKTIEVVEHDSRILPDRMRLVRLPQTDPVLADLLEQHGYLEQANQLRGVS